MVINIRGTYGSGKTVLARMIMDMYHNKEAHFIEGRKRPLYYTFDHPDGGAPFAVVGSYETTCGGCDTISDTAMIFDTVEWLSKSGYDVLYESLLLTADVGRTHQYFLSGWPLNIIQLTTDVDLCLASVNMRRRVKDPHAPPVNPKNLLSKVAGVKSSCNSLAKRGVPIHPCSRTEALVTALNLLNVQHPL